MPVYFVNIIFALSNLILSKMKTLINYRALFDDNPVYRDPTSLLTREQFYILLLWEHGLKTKSIGIILDMPEGTVKSREGDMFSILHAEFGINYNLDYRVLIPKCYEAGILTDKNNVLPHEVWEWIAENNSI
jgi:hypothetical protein